MRIGIDISQLAYPNTGVAVYLKNLVQNLLNEGGANEYVLFYSSMRRKLDASIFYFLPNSNVTIKQFKFPPTLLHIAWNTLHIFPVEWLIGSVDVFVSSDWTQPPSKAKKVTIIYDMIVYKYPKETAGAIIKVQKKRLEWVKKEVDRILCISEATKKDVENILHIPKNKLTIIYPGL